MRAEKLAGAPVQNSDPWDFRRLLRFGFDRNGKKYQHKDRWDHSFLHCAHILRLFITERKLRKVLFTAAGEPDLSRGKRLVST